ncbi:protein serine/threonine phosphatase 2C [Penicillium macrosclerotiorum]|uniref:protein serine/threonine phosphatase 2C n=1 Tax=Penicillium macrosclerotiorum TaxID=303699 RepID=UPI002547ED24|nr:protein serine/threonine phosphatase 2C [Penicillium macrosclerotiorum]KAJ5688879.1 protein serine/threonine phosphatase 2C [Penicillium macrosclerotiorum]
MLLGGPARTRLRVSVKSILRTGTKNSYSSKGSTSESRSSSQLTKYIAAASLITTPGIWWISTSTDDDTARDDVPHLDGPPAKHWSVEPGPSQDQITRIISKGAYSYQVRRIAGVYRYDGAQLASNSPCEDRFTHGKFPSPWDEDSQWMAWGVFDGHLGCQTAELLERQLLPFVRHSLIQAKNMLPPNQHPFTEEVVQRAIRKGFVDLDNSIVKTAPDTCRSDDSLPEKLQKLAPAYAGSCALLSIYEPQTSTLHVACTGDSRAVLGQRQPDGRWVAMPLSVDQTGNNEEEIARVYEEHPGEDGIVKDGRVLGLMVSRAFGDCQWKWPLHFQKDMQQRFNGPGLLPPRYDVQTPPYLTAEPVVTSTRVDPATPSFLIMATDGLWDMISSQQAVDLVGKWMESETARPGHNTEPNYRPVDFGQLVEGERWKFMEERTTVQDNNAAVHLLRNSIGGNHHELIAGRLASSYPSSRRLRDDTTVQVVFFNIADVKK